MLGSMTSDADDCFPQFSKILKENPMNSPYLDFHKISINFHTQKVIPICFWAGIFIFFCTFGLYGTILAQAGPCSKPKVSVYPKNIYPETISHLNKQYGEQSKAQWLQEIQSFVLKELRKNSPGTQFISGKSPDCDYYFYYHIAVIAAGEEIEIIPGLSFFEYTAYWMISDFGSFDRCDMAGQSLDQYITDDDRDLYYTIRRNVASAGDISQRIEEHEETHPVPPRGGRIEVNQDPDYVSPLPDERKMEIKIDMTNCKGEPVYEWSHGQKVTLPRETERGENKATKGFPQGVGGYGSKILNLFMQRPIGASATFELQRGVDPGQEIVYIKSCTHENDIQVETKIPIYGLTIEAVPEKKQIKSGEETKIEMSLFKVSPEGRKLPAVGQEIQLKLDGLMDGQVTPRENIITDNKGKATLHYTAGPRDRKVTFTLRYQPQDFDDFVEDACTVNVVRQQWQAEITYQQIIDVHEEETTAERMVMMKIQALLKPDRKWRPADRKPPAHKMVEEIQKKLSSGEYEKFLDPGTRAELERAMQELQGLAEDVGGIHRYASCGSTVAIIDVFDRSDNHPWGTEKWHWSVQYEAQMQLNIGLITNVADGSYTVSVGVKDPEWNEQPDLPISYQYRASRTFNIFEKDNFRCSGSSVVNLIAGQLKFFVDVPEHKMRFTGKEKTISGMHSWESYGGGHINPMYDVFGTECKEKYPLLLNSKDSLSWKLDRISK